MRKRKFEKSGSTPLKKLLLSVVISLLLFPIFSLFSTIISYNTSDPTGKTALLSLISLLLSGAVSSFTNTRICSDGGVKISLAASFVCSIVFLLIGVISSGGKMALSTLMNILCYLLVCALFAFLGKSKKTKRRKYAK